MTEVSQLKLGNPSDSDSVDVCSSGDNENYWHIKKLR